MIDVRSVTGALGDRHERFYPNAQASGLTFVKRRAPNAEMRLSRVVPAAPE